MIQTKKGIVYEPVFDQNKPLFDWLKKYQGTLDGSRAFEDLVEVYEAAEFDLAQEMIIKNRHVG